MAGHSTWIVPAPMVRISRSGSDVVPRLWILNRLIWIAWRNRWWWNGGTHWRQTLDYTGLSVHSVHSHPEISKNELGCPIIGRSIFHDLSKYRFQDEVFSHKKHLKVAEESWTSMCHTFRLVKAFADNSSHVHVSQIRRLDQKSNIFFVCVRHFVSCQTLLRKAMRDVETTPRTIHDSILESTVSIASRLFQNSFSWI